MCLIILIQGAVVCEALQKENYLKTGSTKWQNILKWQFSTVPDHDITLVSNHHPPAQSQQPRCRWSPPLTFPRSSQNIKVELESVQEELSGTRKDKFMLQAKVGELRNSMKTVLLQNQQLKQDLKQNRLRKVSAWIMQHGDALNLVGL